MEARLNQNQSEDSQSFTHNLIFRSMPILQHCASEIAWLAKGEQLQTATAITTLANQKDHTHQDPVPMLGPLYNWHAPSPMLGIGR